MKIPYGPLEGKTICPGDPLRISIHSPNYGVITCEVQIKVVRLQQQYLVFELPKVAFPFVNVSGDELKFCLSVVEITQEGGVYAVGTLKNSDGSHRISHNCQLCFRQWRQNSEYPEVFLVEISGQGWWLKGRNSGQISIHEKLPPAS
ncbi:MAG: hypothetical protein AAGG51_02965 [Cyanobacteria bacterium P01_G01_bin.54]